MEKVNTSFALLNSIIYDIFFWGGRGVGVGGECYFALEILILHVIAYQNYFIEYSYHIIVQC